MKNVIKKAVIFVVLAVMVMTMCGFSTRGAEEICQNDVLTSALIEEGFEEDETNPGTWLYEYEDDENYAFASFDVNMNYGVIYGRNIDIREALIFVVAWDYENEEFIELSRFAVNDLYDMYYNYIVTEGHF